MGNCKDLIDWNSVIKSIEDQQSAYIGPRHDVGHHVPGVEEVAKPLREAGYKNETRRRQCQLGHVPTRHKF